MIPALFDHKRLKMNFVLNRFRLLKPSIINAIMESARQAVPDSCLCSELLRSEIRVRFVGHSSVVVKTRITHAII